MTTRSLLRTEQLRLHQRLQRLKVLRQKLRILQKQRRARKLNLQKRLRAQMMLQQKFLTKSIQSVFHSLLSTAHLITAERDSLRALQTTVLLRVRILQYISRTHRPIQQQQARFQMLLLQMVLILSVL